MFEDGSHLSEINSANDFSDPVFTVHSQQVKATGSNMTAMHGLLMAMTIASILAGHGEAQEVGHASAGLALAQRLCSQCHAVQKGELQSHNSDSPPFQLIASVPGMTAAALAAALNSSHQTMPNVILKADEQADVVAYILSLK